MRTTLLSLAALALLGPLVLAPASAGVPEGKVAWASGDYGAALLQFRPAADAGDAEAQFYLGEAYRLARGVPGDSDQAMVWYRRSAALGNTRARDALGLTLFASGKRAEAMPLLEKAADGGDARALYVLGTAHFNGDNTTRDWALAYAMMMRASAGGLPQAKTSLDVMDRYLFPADKARAQTLYAGMTGGAAATATASAAPAKPVTVAAATPVAKPAVSAATAPVSPPSIAPARATPQRAAPVVAAAAPPVKPKPDAPRATPPVANAGGAWKVQLGAFGSAERAEAAWTLLSGKVPALKRLDRHVVEAGQVQRLQAWNVADRAAAADLCAAITAAGGQCLAMAPERK